MRIGICGRIVSKPDVSTMSPASTPAVSWTSSAVRTPVVTSRGTARPSCASHTDGRPAPGTTAEAGTSSASSTRSNTSSTSAKPPGWSRAAPSEPSGFGTRARTVKARVAAATPGSTA